MWHGHCWAESAHRHPLRRGWAGLKGKAPGLSPVLHSLALRNMSFSTFPCTTRKLERKAAHSPGSSGVLRKMIKNERNEHVTTNKGGWQDGTDKMEDQKDCAVLKVTGRSSSQRGNMILKSTSYLSKLRDTPKTTVLPLKWQERAWNWEEMLIFSLLWWL